MFWLRNKKNVSHSHLGACYFMFLHYITCLISGPKVRMTGNTTHNLQTNPRYRKEDTQNSNSHKIEDSKKTIKVKQPALSSPSVTISKLFCLFVLILYVPSTIFHLNKDGSSWVEPVLS